MAVPTRATPRPPLRVRVRAYFVRHAQTFVGALGRMSRHPFASLMTVAVIGIALALPAALHLLVANGKVLAGSFDSVADITVYLERGTEAARVEGLVEELLDWPEVAAIKTIGADDALVEFALLSGFGDALEALPENPLPDTLVVTPRPAHTDPESLASLAEALRLVPESELVQIDTDWIKRFNAILEVVRRAVRLTAILLAIAVVLIVGNTIRLDIENRRGEIEVTKLVGASDGFVRRPFLYSGFWYGFTGGLLASILIGLGLVLLRGPVAELAGLYGSGFALVGPGLKGLAAIIGGGAALGWIGSWIATTRHLRRIEPG